MCYHGQANRQRRFVGISVVLLLLGIVLGTAPSAVAAPTTPIEPLDGAHPRERLVQLSVWHPQSKR